MSKTCNGLEGLRLAPIPLGYVSPQARMGKAVNLDSPKAVSIRTKKHMEEKVQKKIELPLMGG